VAQLQGPMNMLLTGLMWVIDLLFLFTGTGFCPVAVLFQPWAG